MKKHTFNLKHPFMRPLWQRFNLRSVALTGVIVGIVVVGWLAVARLNAATVVFPLKVADNGRYLVDQNNRPFLYTADTAWVTVSRLSVADAKRYIDIKLDQGFNTIQSELLVWNRENAGDKGAPFHGSMTEPNESYWAGVDEIIKYAESKQMLVVAWPMWLADNGGWADSSAPSESEYVGYMTWLGNRYKNQPNIIWALGGDEEISQRNSLTMAGQRALKAADPTHLMTYHPRSNAYSLRGENWLSYNSFQWNDNTGPKSYQSVREGYELSPVKPILDAEPPYVPNPCCGDLKTSLQRNRANGWWAILAGAMGVTYGGDRTGTWNIGGDGQKNWTATADQSGKHTGNIRKILESYVWHKLQPDWANQTVTGGRGSYGDTNYVTAGLADDGSLLVAYAPEGGTLTVNTAKISGTATAQWYDPVTGAPSGSAQTVPLNGSQSFRAPDANAGGDRDWVLVIYTASGRATDAVGPTATVVVTPTPAPSSGVGEKALRTYTTAYTYYDNTPPGSATISHPILHTKAGGKGTYDDPITLAVGHILSGGRDILDYPAGTKFYIPNVRRYFIVEDTCGDGATPQNGPCHTGYPSGTDTWLDLWIDGASGNTTAVENCASNITDSGGEMHIAIQNPAADYAVVSGPVFQNGACTELFGNTAVKTTVTPAAPTTTPVAPTITPAPVKPGDIDANGRVDIADLTLLLTGWSNTSASNDVNRDGRLDVYDLSILLSNWGSKPPS